MAGHRPTKSEVRAVACPLCRAQPKTPCVSAGKARRHHHAERVRRYRDGLFGPLSPVPTTDETQQPTEEDRT